MSTDRIVPSQRPRVICHMMASVDGRIVTGGWPLSAEGRQQFELVHTSYEADGWICGRVTMEPFAGGVLPGPRRRRQPRLNEQSRSVIRVIWLLSSISARRH
ncbi:MAG: hypothetical protein ACT4P6_19880 [Gemmatimonadaceae bacterium]